MVEIGSAGGGGYQYPTDIPGGGGSGGCYSLFRREHPPENNVKAFSVEGIIQLLDNLKEAQYSWNYHIKIVGDEIETGWFYEIPFPKEEIRKFWARDDNGGLEFTKSSEDKRKTRFIIKYRKPLTHDESLNFSFGYTTQVLSSPFESYLHTNVPYMDWWASNTPCDYLSMSVNLPSNSTSITTVPPTKLIHNPIKFEAKHLRGTEYFNFLLIYKKKRIGKPFWIWLAGAICSATIGTAATIMFT